MLARVHIRKRGEYAIGGERRYFARLPVVGEFLAMNIDGQWYQVELVIHCPFPCGWKAEIYAVQVDHHEIKAQVFADAKGSTKCTVEDDPDAEVVRPLIRERLVFVPHNGEWLRETLDEAGQIYDFVGLMPWCGGLAAKNGRGRQAAL
jgi:hypothetical protein